MYNFLGTLVEFVLPRLRKFDGVVLPPQSSSFNSPSAISGVVTFGLPLQAMGFFPQIEVNQDAYPEMYGMHIHFVTNATGLGAEHRVLVLLFLASRFLSFAGCGSTVSTSVCFVSSP
jgi:large subunit ribosomal protein L5